MIVGLRHRQDGDAIKLCDAGSVAEYWRLRQLIEHCGGVYDAGRAEKFKLIDAQVVVENREAFIELIYGDE